MFNVARKTAFLLPLLALASATQAATISDREYRAFAESPQMRPSAIASTTCTYQGGPKSSLWACEPSQEGD